MDFANEEWNEAASLIFVSKSKTNKANEQDFEILMTKRSKNSSFFGSAYVFPGGHLETSDFSSKWMNVFINAGYTTENVLSVINRIKGPRPPLINHNKMANKLDKTIIASDIALRISAIRETFEEAGVLLISSGKDGRKELTESNSWFDFKLWRSKIFEDSNQFIELCLQLKYAPNIWDIREWWNWLTPQAIKHKRFDTMFYIYCTLARPSTNVDDKEISKIEWYTPTDLLIQQDRGQAFLAPPQVYELSRLTRFKNYQQIKEFSETREAYGVNRWLPIIYAFFDGTCLILPGDDKYPKNLENIYYENASSKIMPTLEESRSKSVNLNRIELRVPICRTYCNIKLNCGHLSPTTFVERTLVQSSL